MHREDRSTPTRFLCIAALGLALAGCAAPSTASVGSPRSATLSAAATSISPAAHIDSAALHAQVSVEQPRLKAEGINIVAWGPDPQTGRERITVQDLTPAATATLEGAFGSGNIILVSTPYPTVACGCPASAVSPGPRPGPPPQLASPSN